MSLKKLLVLAVLFGALLAYVLLFERGKVPEKRQIFRLPTFEITKIELSGKDGTVVLEKKDKHTWRITQPIQALADSGEVEALLKSVVDLVASQQLGKVDELKDLTDDVTGFSKPYFTLKLWRGDKPLTLVIGKETPLSGSRYALLKEKQEVYALSTYATTPFEKTADELRDKHLATLKPAEVQRFTVKSKHQTLAFAAKRENNEQAWDMIEPVKAKADTWAVKDLVRQLTDLKAADFPTGKDAPSFEKAGVTPEKAQYIVTLQGKHTTDTIYFGERKPASDQVYALNPAKQELMLVKDDILDALDKKPMDLRDKRLADFETYKVQQIEIEGGTKPVKLERDEDANWKFVLPFSGLAKTSDVNDLLWDLQGLEAKRFVDEPKPDLAKYGLDKPKYVVKLSFEHGKPVELAFGKQDEKQHTVFVLNRRTGMLAETSDTVLGKLGEAPEKWKVEPKPADASKEPKATTGEGG